MLPPPPKRPAAPARDQPDRTAAIHTVFSVDGSRYQRWRADLLAFSHRAVGQRGPVTRLWSASTRPTAFAGQTFWTDPYSPHPTSDDDYAPYNKPAAILRWLSESSPPEETILLLDPDCVFLAPVLAEAPLGRPISQPIGYMDPGAGPAAELAVRHCRRPSAVQPLGIPTLVHRDDLRALAPLWLAKTEAIRSDRRGRQLAGWPAEMWGYAFAAAELGLDHDLRQLAAFPGDDRIDLPIVHYCYHSQDPDARWRWDKRDYRPWEPVPDPPLGTAMAATALIRVLNACAAARPYSLAG